MSNSHSKKQKLQCPTCGINFSNLSQHWHRSSSCSVPESMDHFLQLKQLENHTPNLSSRYNLRTRCNSNVPAVNFSCVKVQRPTTAFATLENDTFTPIIDYDDENNPDSFLTDINELPITQPSIIDDPEHSNVKVIPTNDEWQSFTCSKSGDHYDFPISPQDRFCMRIFDVLEHSGCHKGVFTEVIKIIKEEMNAGFVPSRLVSVSRETFINRMSRRFPSPSPITYRMQLEPTKCGDVEFANIVTFDFKQQLDSLITDLDLFGNLDNLQINPESDNPWGEMGVNPRNKGLDDIHTGNWYKRTYKELVKDPSKDMLFPIILYIDKTGTDRMNRYGVEPLIFTTSILNRSARNRSRSWRALGFIPGIDQKSSAQKEMERGSQATHGRSMRNYHACLEKILSSLHDIQKSPHTAFVRLGDKIKKVRLHLPVAFIMGDAKSQDCLVTRYGGYQTKFVCRACHCPFDSLDDAFHKCKFMKSQITDRLVDIILNTSNDAPGAASIIKDAREALQGFSRHVCHSALRSLKFGDQPFGYLGATPTDLMHAFLEGVLKYTIQNFTSKLNPRGKYDIDNMVDEMFGGLRSSQKKDFPRINFSHGVTNLSFVTAEEWVGLGLCYLLVCLSKRGQCLLKKVHNDDIQRYNNQVSRQKSLPRNHPDKNLEINLPILSPTDFLEVLEALLCFHAWYKSGSPYKIDGASRLAYEASICKMLELVKTRLPRCQGNGWKLQKFHEIKHCIRDMMEFGCASNYDTGPCENSLIHFVKNPSSTAQKRGHDTFIAQLAKNLSDREVMLKAQRCMKINTFMLGDHDELMGSINGIHRQVDRVIEGIRGDRPGVQLSGPTMSSVTDTGEIKSSFPAKPQWRLRFASNGNLQSRSWLGKKSNVEPMSLDAMVVSELSGVAERHAMSNANFLSSEIVIDCYTEYIRDSHRYRAHPNFRSSGSWYDWVLVRYDTGEQESATLARTGEYSPFVEFGLYPSKVLCFFTVAKSLEKMALIHPCADSDHTGDSVITETWVLDYTKHQTKLRANLDIVSVDSFDRPVFVIEEFPGLHPEIDPASEDSSRTVLVVKSREEWANSFTLSG